MRRRSGFIESSKFAKKSADAAGFAILLIFIDRRLSHEAMLEAMALVVEARAKIGRQHQHAGQSSEACMGLAGPDPIRDCLQ
jgi:adenosylcobinamide amidohydrolase